MVIFQVSRFSIYLLGIICLFARSAEFFSRMGIKEIQQIEKANNCNILLLQEGMFWRAYEKSAYLFVKHIKEYALTKRFYKNIGQDIVYLGFPKNSFSDVEGVCSEKKLIIPVILSVHAKN